MGGFWGRCAQFTFEVINGIIVRGEDEKFGTFFVETDGACGEVGDDSQNTDDTVGHHFFETMRPTAFLAPTLIAKTCFICTQPKHAFFLAQLALQGHRANGKKPLPGRVPGPKKGTKMVPKSWSFQKEFFCSVAKKKSQKLDRALP